MHLPKPNFSFKGILLPLLFASVAFWASTWLATKNDSEPTPQASNLQGLEWKAENTTLWSYHSANQQTQLTASNIQSEQNSSQVELNNLTVTHSQNNQLSYGSANHGVLVESQFLIIDGDVTLEQKQPQSQEISTQKLDIDLNSGLAQTDLPVKIVQPEMTTTAVGMSLNSESGILELLNSVHSTYIRKPSED